VTAASSAARAALLAAAIAASACAGAAHVAFPTGTIAGLARDRASGDPIAKAAIAVRAEGAALPHLATRSGDRGRYSVPHLSPGRYRLSATFAGQPLEVANIEVRAGQTTEVELVFTLERPEPIWIDLRRAGALGP
jgi:hypothetical protein